MIATMAHLVNYCLDCEWAVSTEDRTQSEQSELVIEHGVVTRHDIDCEHHEPEEPATGWADEWPPTE